MNEIAVLILTLLAGIALGAIFYGGLWWTVRRSVSFKSSGLWFVGSFLVRAVIAVGGLYFVSRGNWRSWLACLLGFFIARIAVTRLIKRVPVEEKNRRLQGIGP
jgi:F1F0 ATPase subunit 2